jgi:hypothetical protein
MMSDVELAQMIGKAKDLELRRPRWILIVGLYTRQFVAFPRFNAPFLVSADLDVLEASMRRVEDESLRCAA